LLVNAIGRCLEGGWLSGRRHLITVERQQAVEKRAVTFEGLAKIFGVSVFAASPLSFKLLTLRGKLLCDSVDDFGDQYIRLFHSDAGFVDEGRLHLIPTRTKLVQLICREKRIGL